MNVKDVFSKIAYHGKGFFGSIFMLRDYKDFKDADNVSVFRSWFCM